MKRRNRFKLNMIGILMLVSQIVLVIFVGKWIASQYMNEKMALSKKLEQLYAAEHEHMIDSLVQHNVTNPIMDSIHIGRKILKGGDPRQPADDPPFAAIASTSGEPWDINTSTGFSYADSTMLNRGIRTFVVKLSNEVRMPPFLHLDSIKFRKRFEQAAKRELHELNISWLRKSANDDAILLNTGGHVRWSTGYIYNYQPLILRKIGPQIGFSTLLLLLCGMAFLLSYTTVRKQLKLSAQKDSFISNMSHELKTPVATAKVAIEALRKYDGINDPVKTRDYLQMVAWEIDRLEGLIGNVLNNVQLEEGKMVMQKQTFDLTEMLQDMIGGMQPLFYEKGKRVSCKISDKISMINGDQIHLQGAVYNVLDNAIKYGGSMIDVEMRNEEDRLEILVSDDGPGVPEEYNRKIFERFFRIPSGNVHNVKGYGLGLNYTRFVVQAHDGNIQQRNNEKGGATFIISLPLLLV